MPNDLSVQAVPPLRAAGELAVPQRDLAPASNPVPAESKPAKLYANPDFHFDAAAGLVVIEFRNDSGKVTDTIPNHRQLDAYRAHAGAPGDVKSPDGTAATG